MADKYGASSMHNSDSDVFQSVEVPSSPMQNQKMKVKRESCRITYSTSNGGYYNRICILCIAWLAWNQCL